jgi:hypothetical protein
MKKTLAIEINDKRAGWIEGEDGHGKVFAWESFDLHGDSLGKSITRMDAIRKLASYLGIRKTESFGYRDYEKERVPTLKRGADTKRKP